ncbi:hypothetical protein PoB_002708000 [Plakobranchus ocellatus]|uniref:Uncharacterized protein n=1 Tax=Plakobranchus ocellatus TaxID=259542 RepID=A0AAV3ZZE9_9GAST|nr:hypothetical protein PoB_002708000 [Plakobranchus ocellatus]
MEGEADVVEDVREIEWAMEGEGDVVEDVREIEWEMGGKNASMICEMFGLCFGPDTLHCSLTNRLATSLNALNKYLQPLLSKMARDRETPVMDHVTDLITKKYPQVKLMKHL